MNDMLLLICDTLDPSRMNKWDEVVPQRCMIRCCGGGGADEQIVRKCHGA